ncbi:hypothetical protein [Pseudomonas nunensis]|uniref:hypothetical protein n=1 Tax=Pseudomonas nunensis TaxID=2961896 RepID=UPI0006B5C1A1|nr:hypothetical protein [Pseudomonas nunensis]
MTKLIPQHQLAGQQGQALDSHQATDALRQALNYPDDLQGFDDLLQAVGANRSNYSQSTHQQKIIDAVRNGDWVVVKPRIDPDSGGASWNGVRTRPEPPAQHLVEDHAFTQPKPAESGFHIVQSPMSLDALERSLYDNPPGDALRQQFRSLNRHLGEHVKPGQMVIFSDTRHYLCRREEAQMMIAAEKVNEALKDLSDEEAAFMVEHHEVIEPFLEVSAGSLGVASFMIGQHLENLKINLKDLETLHQQQYRKYGHLNSAEFFSKRKRIMTNLDASLGPLTRKGVGIADHPKLKRALGLSTRRTIHRWDKAGAPTQLPGYATHIEGVAKAAKYMQAGGYVGIGLAASAASMRINEVCRAGMEEPCRKVKYIQGGKLAGNVGGAAIATAYTAPLTMEYCAGVALRTRGIGGVICVLLISGATASLSGNAGSKAAEATAETLYEAATRD